MASPTQWTRVWINSRSWWWIGRPGVLHSMGLQRVGHNWATELNWRPSKKIPKLNHNEKSDWRKRWEYLLTANAVLIRILIDLNALEKAMAPHSSILAWKLAWMEEPGGLHSMGSLRVGYDWATSLSLFTFMHWRRKWQPTPVFLPGESQGWGNLDGLPSLGSHTVRHYWSDLAVSSMIKKKKFKVKTEEIFRLQSELEPVSAYQGLQSLSFLKFMSQRLQNFCISAQKGCKFLEWGRCCCCY